MHQKCHRTCLVGCSSYIDRIREKQKGKTCHAVKSFQDSYNLKKLLLLVTCNNLKKIKIFPEVDFIKCVKAKRVKISINQSDTTDKVEISSAGCMSAYTKGKIPILSEYESFYLFYIIVIVLSNYLRLQEIASEKMSLLCSLRLAPRQHLEA